MTFLLSAILSGTSLRAADSMILIADFEDKDYGDFKVSGKAFGEKTNARDTPKENERERFSRKRAD